MLQKAMRMDSIYGLKLAQLIFSVSALFSINLQAKDTSILQEARGRRPFCCSLPVTAH